MQDIQFIILDMDGTIYDLNDIMPFQFESAKQYLVTRMNYSENDADKLLRDNLILPYMTKQAHSVTELFMRLNADMKDFNHYRFVNNAYDRVTKENAMQKETLMFFKSKAKVVLLTNNCVENMEKVLKHIGIDKNLFDGTYTNENSIGITKTETMRHILEIYNVSPENALSIGDRYEIDCKPMISLGGKGIAILGPNSFKKIMEDFNHFKTCDEYDYFE